MKISQAPAKINLALHVTGQREDGFHLLDTLVVFADTVTASDSVIVSAAPRDGFDVSGAQEKKLGAARDNLVLLARDLVRKSAKAQGIDTAPVHISLEKRLPVASGIGGGSADAAATFKLLHRHWNVPYKAELTGPEVLSKELGADVPMCLMGGPLRATGIGEKLNRLADFPALHIVLINCGRSVSTPEVFGQLEEKDNPAIFDMPEIDFIDWLKERTRNDLQASAAALCKPITQSLKLLVASGALLARMSGSGATCFGIFNSAREASEAAKSIQAVRPNWWVVATHTGASQEQNL